MYNQVKIYDQWWMDGLAWLHVHDFDLNLEFDKKFLPRVENYYAT